MSGIGSRIKDSSIGDSWTGDKGTDYNDSIYAFSILLSKYIADGDGDFAAGRVLPSNTSLVDIIGNYTGPYNGAAADDNIKAALDLIATQLTVGEVTGDADIDISEYDYTTYINCLTVTASATGLASCRIDIDFNKLTTGWDTIATAGDTLNCVCVVQTDGTNYRSTQIASAQITANGDGSLDASESGMSFVLGPMQANASIQIHVKLSAERADCELPYRVTYVGAAPTVTPIAAGV